MYALYNSITFKTDPQSQIWKKGTIWAENFVPRVDWGAREPRGLENFPIPATVGVMGHHTAWDRCWTKEECSKEVRKIQAFHMGPEDCV